MSKKKEVYIEWIMYDLHTHNVVVSAKVGGHRGKHRYKSEKRPDFKQARINLERKLK